MGWNNAIPSQTCKSRSQIRSQLTFDGLFSSSHDKVKLDGCHKTVDHWLVIIYSVSCVCLMATKRKILRKAETRENSLVDNDCRKKHNSPCSQGASGHVLQQNVPRSNKATLKTWSQYRFRTSSYTLPLHKLKAKSIQSWQHSRRTRCFYLALLHPPDTSTFVPWSGHPPAM